KVFDHVSDSFRYGSSNKSALQQRGEQARQSGQVTEIPIWDVQIDPIGRNDTTATASFGVKAIGPGLGENQFRCKARFVREPGGQWRLQGFDLFMIAGSKDPYQVPGLN